ncbi:aminotransferase class I/II-fold pyridoxal phosphate-dependent enzyme [Streptomyces sp. NPDC058000]|uniref:aminotransferase class I/II-fold pyridoxal phosphate-dependent enzyme n=1 Tax=Streptomyces sp. NPDC058000 TaxID=3346299 RepID=UPI0036EF6FF2
MTARTPERSLRDWFPTAAAVWDLEPRSRNHVAGQLNLKSCELLHPAVARWHADQLGRLAPATVVEYPLTGPSRDAVAAHFGQDPARVLLTPGSDHAIHLVCEALVAPAGRLVIARPHFDSWTRCAARLGFRLDSVDMPHRAPMAVTSLIERLLSGPPSVLVITQPDSITGQLHTRAELTQAVTAAHRHGSVVVIDTCYLAYADDREATLRGLEAWDNVLRINSFSKSHGLAGARVGAVLAQASVIDYLARWAPDGMLSHVSLALLERALAEPAVFRTARAEVRTARAALARGVQRALPGWSARSTQANFVAFDAEHDDATRVHTALLAGGIRTRLLSGVPGFSGGLRVATPSLSAVRRVTDVLAGLPTPTRS